MRLFKLRFLFFQREAESISRIEYPVRGYEEVLLRGKATAFARVVRTLGVANAVYNRRISTQGVPLGAAAAAGMLRLWQVGY